MSSLFRRWTHVLAAVVIGAALLAGLFALGSWGAQAAGDKSADDKQADVVVQFDDSRTVIRPITFTTPISGLKALVQSGLQVGTAKTGFGEAVCSIEGVGCPVDDCFCDPNRFWNYTYWDGNAWQGYLSRRGFVRDQPDGGDRGLALGRVWRSADPCYTDAGRRSGIGVCGGTTGDHDRQLRQQCA